MKLWNKTGIVLELQRDCLNSDVSVSSILRKAKAIASKLDLNDLVSWMEQELNGYTGRMIDVPSYRKGRGQPKFWNPYRGYCPIMVNDDAFGNIVSTFYLNQGVAELEDLIKSDGGILIFCYPPMIQAELRRGMDIDMECSLHFSKSQVKSALDYVRNKLLDWTLGLEKKGILGEGFSFDEHDKSEAVAVTNHIYGSTIGVLGNVAGDANNSRFITASNCLDIDLIRSFLDQAEPASEGLPSGTKEKTKALLRDIRAESDGPRRPDKVRSLIGSLRKVLEGAGGNLVAQAILSAI